jgi:hypothetical protein
MGNTLNSGNKLLYNYNENNVFREEMNKILFNIKDNVNGREVYINRRKAFCRTNGLPPKIMGDNDMSYEYLNLKLPGVINSIDELNYTQNGENVMKKSKLSSFNVILQNKESDFYKNKSDFEYTKSDGSKVIQKDLYNINTCEADMEDICAKQLYKNKCVIYKNNNWVWDNENPRCFIVDDLNKFRFQSNYQNIQNIEFTQKNFIDYIFLFHFIVKSYNVGKIDRDYTWTENNDEFLLFNNGSDDLNLYIVCEKNILNVDNWDSSSGKYISKIEELNLIVPFNKLNFKSILEMNKLPNEKIKEIFRYLYINYLYSNEGIYEKVSLQSKNFYYGEDTCTCLNSMYGKNLNNIPDKTCKLIDNNGRYINNVGELKQIIEDTNEPLWRRKEAAECIQYINTNNYSNQVGNNMYNHNFGNESTNSNSKYSIKLTGNEELSKQNGGLNPYQQDYRCRDKVNIQKDKGTQPFHLGTNTLSEVTCVNQINFNNLSVENIYIGNILQNNTCGNIGEVNQFFITPSETGQNSYSSCPSGYNSGLILSGFNVSFIQGKLVKALFSNLNGFYISSTDFNKPDNFLAIYENINDSSIILAIKKIDDRSIEFKLYKIYGTSSNVILSSRIFKYNKESNKEGENEEMCVDQNLKKIYVFNKYLNTISSIESKNTAISKFVNDEGLDNFLTINSFGANMTEKFINIANKIPNYKWSNNVELFHTSNISGIINHNGTGLFSKGTSLFDSSVRDNIKDKYYLRINDTTLHGKLVIDNNNLTPFILFDNIKNNIVNYYNNISFYNDKLGNTMLTDSTLRANGLDSSNIKVLDLVKLIDYVKNNNKYLLIFNPNVYRYIIIKGDSIISVSNITYKLSDIENIVFTNNFNFISSNELTTMRLNIDTTFNNINIEFNDNIQDLLGISFNVDKHDINLNISGNTVSLKYKNVFYYVSDDNKYELILNNDRWEIYIDNVLSFVSRTANYGLDIITLSTNPDYFISTDGFKNIEHFTDTNTLIQHIRVRFEFDLTIKINTNVNLTKNDGEKFKNIFNNHPDFNVTSFKINEVNNPKSIWLNIKLISNNSEVNMYLIVNNLLNSGLINFNKVKSDVLNVISINIVDDENSDSLLSKKPFEIKNDFKTFNLNHFLEVECKIYYVNTPKSNEDIINKLNLYLKQSNFTNIDLINFSKSNSGTQFNYNFTILIDNMNENDYNIDTVKTFMQNFKKFMNKDFTITFNSISFNSNLFGNENPGLTNQTKINEVGRIKIDNINILELRKNEVIVKYTESNNIKILNYIDEVIDNINNKYKVEFNILISNLITLNYNYSLIDVTILNRFINLKQEINLIMKEFEEEYKDKIKIYYSELISNLLLEHKNDIVTCRTPECENEIILYLTKLDIRCTSSEDCYNKLLEDIKNAGNKNKLIITISIIIAIIAAIGIFVAIKK